MCSRCSQGTVFDLPPQNCLEDGRGKARPLTTTLHSYPKEGGGQSRPSSSSGGNPSHLNQATYDIPSLDPYYVQYTESRSVFIDQVSNPVTTCRPNYFVTECECGRLPVVSGCGKKTCTFCKSDLGMRRARRIMKRWHSLMRVINNYERWPKVTYTVFTIPEELRPNCLSKKWITEYRRKAWLILQEKFGAEFCIEATHPISEDHPKIFHPHFNFLWVPRKGFSNFIDLDVLQQSWRDALEYQQPVDVWTHYSNEPAKLWKWSQYITRIFPEFAAWSGCVRWYGHIPKLPKEKGHICPVCQQYIRLLGILLPNARAMFLEHDPKSGAAPPGIKDSDIIFFKQKNQANEYAHFG